jgi:hypothetical protein
LIEGILTDIMKYDDSIDVFIFGNLEIQEFHAGNEQNRND